MSDNPQGNNGWGFGGPSAAPGAFMFGDGNAQPDQPMDSMGSEDQPMDAVDTGPAMDMSGGTHQTIDPDYDDLPALLDPAEIEKIPYAVPQYILDITTDPELIKEIMAAEEAERLKTRRAADDDEASARLALQLQVEEEDNAKKNYARTHNNGNSGFGTSRMHKIMICLDKRVQKDEKPKLGVRAQPLFGNFGNTNNNAVAAPQPLFGAALGSPNGPTFSITPPERPSAGLASGGPLSPGRIKTESLPTNYMSFVSGGQLNPGSDAMMEDISSGSHSDSDSEGDDNNNLLDDVRPVNIADDATVAELMQEIVKSDIFPIRKVSHIKHLSLYSPQAHFPVFGSLNTDAANESEWAVLSNRFRISQLSLNDESVIKVTLRKKDRNRKRKSRDARPSTPASKQDTAESAAWQQKYAELHKKYEKVQNEYGQLQQTWVMDKLPTLSIETPSPKKAKAEEDSHASNTTAMFDAFEASSKSHSPPHSSAAPRGVGIFALPASLRNPAKQSAATNITQPSYRSESGVAGVPPTPESPSRV